MQTHYTFIQLLISPKNEAQTQHPKNQKLMFFGL